MYQAYTSSSSPYSSLADCRLAIFTVTPLYLNLSLAGLPAPYVWLIPYSACSMAKSHLVPLLLAAKTIFLARPPYLTSKLVISISCDFCPWLVLILKINAPKSVLTSCWQCYRLSMCLTVINSNKQRWCLLTQTVLVKLSSQFSGGKHFWAGWILLYLLGFPGCNKLSNLAVFLYPGWVGSYVLSLNSQVLASQTGVSHLKRKQRWDGYLHSIGLISTLHLPIPTVLLHHRNETPVFGVEHKIHVNF